MPIPAWARGRPLVRLNQWQQPAGMPVHATAVSSATAGHLSRLCDAHGGLVCEGLTNPRGIGASSGLAVHDVELESRGRHGSGFRVWVDGIGASHPFDIGLGGYGDLARDALRVLTLLRSGFEFAAEFGDQARPAGHLGRWPNTGDIRVPAWQSSDAAELYPGWRCRGVFDVRGGWYDAGDYGKYVTSGSTALCFLLTAVADGSTDNAFGQALHDECWWQLEWLLRMQVPSGLPFEGQVFHRVHGTDWSPVPGWAHEDPTQRVLHRPSTIASLQFAAVVAHASRVLAVDRGEKGRLLSAAERAYAAARSHPDLLPPDDHGRHGGGPYSDSDATDDFYWAASELWLATQDDRYLDDLRANSWHGFGAHVFREAGFDVDSVAALGLLDLADAGTVLPEHAELAERVRAGAETLMAVQTRQPWGQPYAPADGWARGSNGRLLNNLTLISRARLLPKEVRIARVAAGMDYLMGRNGLGQSYVVGYGREPQLCYIDEPWEVTNDVCIRWQAPLVLVAGFLHQGSAENFHPEPPRRPGFSATTA